MVRDVEGVQAVTAGAIFGLRTDRGAMTDLNVVMPLRNTRPSPPVSLPRESLHERATVQRTAAVELRD
jgi:hypothetical protein